MKTSSYGMLGKRHSQATKNKIGLANSKALKGRTLPESVKDKIRMAHLKLRTRPPIYFGEESPNWKGDLVGYHALHDWVRSKLGKPNKCEHCKTQEKNKQYHWANKSQNYKRELSDWIRLCVPCHSKYDRNGDK